MLLNNIYKILQISTVVCCTIIFFAGFLLSIAYIVLVERKLLGAIQRRKGPNKVGFFGLLQPLADGFKLLIKEYILPKKAETNLFFGTSYLTFVVSFLLLSSLPLSNWFSFVPTRYAIFLMLGILSVNTLLIPLAGWSSHSRYGFLGGVRDLAQIISYELSLTTLLTVLFFMSGDYGFYGIILSQIDGYNVIYGLPVYLVFIVVCLAKLNRVPFDLPEGEAEIVAGFNVEYSSFIFALFFLGEYGNIFFISFLCAILFFGAWIPFPAEENWISGIASLIVKVVFHFYLIIWIRGTLPRYRYDQLIKLGWKFLLPVCFTLLIFFYFIG